MAVKLYYKKLFAVLLCILVLNVTLTGCESKKSAKDTLVACATALEQNDAQGFINSFDLKSCAANEIKNVTQANDALFTLDQLGRNLGIGGMDDLIGNVFDMENSLRQEFVRKSSTGELANECASQSTPGCPWVPKSLVSAQIKEYSQNVAVARVKTPKNLTTWLALAKNKAEKWVIVGWATLEDTAKTYAEDFVAGKNIILDNKNSQQKPAGKQHNQKNKDDKMIL